MENTLSLIKSLYRNAAEKDRSSSTLYDLLFNIIETAITQKDIPPGSHLPSTRLLAKELGISRSTVVQAYELLKVGNLIESRQGSGYEVKAARWEPKDQAGGEVLSMVHPALSERGVAFLHSIPFLEPASEAETAFRPGLPPLDIFPVNQWKILTNQYWRHVKNDELGYMESSGAYRLREKLAAYLNFTRKIKCAPEQIIVLSGSLQSIYLIGSLLLNPGDCAAYENPTFPNVISLFKGLQADVRPIPVDEQGLIVSDLAQKGMPFPKLIHTAPSCHYPTAVRMSLARRQELLQWANQHGSVIIENDYEHEVNNYLDFIPSIYSLDEQQRTFFLGTFNRLLHPSIRVAYMVVPPVYLDAIKALLRYLSLVVPYALQLVLSQFIEKNYIYNHISTLIEVAQKRKASFCSMFEECFEGHMRLNKTGARSLHVLAEFNEPVSDQKLIHYLRTKEIAVHAYSKTFAGESFQNGLILGYAPVNESEIKRNLLKMKKMFFDFKKSGTLL